MSCPASGGQQTKTVRQTLIDLLWRHDLRPRGGQFDRQWNAIQTTADLGYGPHVPFVYLEARQRRLSAFDEELDGFVLPQLSQGQVSVRQRQTGDSVCRLSLDLQ